MLYDLAQQRRAIGSSLGERDAAGSRVMANQHGVGMCGDRLGVALQRCREHREDGVGGVGGSEAVGVLLRGKKLLMVLCVWCLPTSQSAQSMEPSGSTSLTPLSRSGL